MKKVLVINSSANGLHSQSRKLTEVFAGHWKTTQPCPVICLRELGNTDVPHISETWIAAAFKPEAARSVPEMEALKMSDLYISELREADIIVLGSPMYNWSIPSTLKAYIDQVLRVNETFTVDRTNRQHPYVGLLQNKTLILLLSRGEQGYEKGEYNEQMNFQSTYLKTVFNIIGITDIHIIAIEGKSSGAEQYSQSIARAHQEIKDLIERQLT